MASITMLCARIEELSLSIERQKQVLRDLERHKSNAESDLNAILDPIGRSCAAFPTDPSTAPMVLLNICRSWSNIALSTPSLWTTIRIDSSLAETLDQLLATWIHRTCGLPMSLSLIGPLDKGVQLSVKQNASLIHNIEPYIDSARDLKHIGTAAFFSLKSLTVDGTSVVGPDVILIRCLAMLRAAPALVDCDFVNTQSGMAAEGPQPQHLTHSCLQHLYLGRPDPKNPINFHSTWILDYLTLPALETLTLARPDYTLQKFLASCDGPQSLELDIRLVAHWEECFRLVPSVSDLTLFFNTSEAIPFFAMLDPAQNLLPNLRNLTIMGDFSNRSQHERLVNLLTARKESSAHHAQIQSFAWIDSDNLVEDDVLAALRKLETDGTMQIHIGYNG